MTRFMARFALSAQTRAVFFLAASLVPWLPLRSQTADPDDFQAATALVHEAVAEFSQSAYRAEPIPVLYTRALLGLTLQLGPDAQKHATDLAQLSPAEAESAFMEILRRLADSPGQRRSLRELAETALQVYCRQFDAYTRYTKGEDVKMIEMMSGSGGSSIGMSIQDKDGGFLCYPMPGSPASLAGIKPGDRLLSVDGKPIEGKPLEFIASQIRGAPGSEVNLRVQRSFGRAETLKVTRETLTNPSVVVEKKLSGYVIRVRKFSKELLQETRSALQNLSPGSTLTLDFRSCPGGDLDVAIKFAAMFLSKGEPIVSIHCKDQPVENHVAENEPEFKPAAIILLQDEGTASAAELVIAALISSSTAKAASQGEKTYGKGVAQDRIPLKGGGSLLVTRWELVAPQGRTWDGIGLLPSMKHQGKIFPADSVAPSVGTAPPGSSVDSAVAPAPAPPQEAPATN